MKNKVIWAMKRKDKKTNNSLKYLKTSIYSKTFYKDY